MQPKTIQTNIQQTDNEQTNLMKRLDKLEWSSWHTTVAIVLGTGWAMDAYETQVSASAISLISSTFDIKDDYQQSLISSVWTFGGVFGALLFGWVCDAFGRKSTFMLTLVCEQIIPRRGKNFNF
jgi:MFS family permease